MTTQEIINCIEPGSLVILHASFAPCKREENLTPQQVLNMLIDRLGENGTLMAPTFTYSYSKIWNIKPFDKNTTPGNGNGILSETLRQMPGAVRSNNPTYSVAVYGKYAHELTDGSNNYAGLGHGSSYENALKLGAKILLLNVASNRNSMLHCAEVLSQVPYNDIPFRECWGRTALTIDGEVELNGEFPACSDEFSKLDAEFVAAGFSQKLGNSYLIDAQKMCEYTIAKIKAQPDIMLCHNEECEPCTVRRHRLRSLGLI